MALFTLTLSAFADQHCLEIQDLHDFTACQYAVQDYLRHDYDLNARGSLQVFKTSIENAHSSCQNALDFFYEDLLTSTKKKVQMQCGYNVHPDQLELLNAILDCQLAVKASCEYIRNKPARSITVQGCMSDIHRGTEVPKPLWNCLESTHLVSIPAQISKLNTEVPCAQPTIQTSIAQIERVVKDLKPKRHKTVRIQYVTKAEPEQSYVAPAHLSAKSPPVTAESFVSAEVKNELVKIEIEKNGDLTSESSSEEELKSLSDDAIEKLNHQRPSSAAMIQKLEQLIAQSKSSVTEFGNVLPQDIGLNVAQAEYHIYKDVKMGDYPDILKAYQARTNAFSEIKKQWKAENPPENFLQKIAGERDLLLDKFGMKNYARDEARLTDLWLHGEGNCVSRALSFLQADGALGLKLPKPWKRGLQAYTDHVQMVAYNTETHLIYDYLTGEPVVIKPGKEAVIYDPIVVLLELEKLLGGKSRFNAEDFLYTEKKSAPVVILEASVKKKDDQPKYDGAIKLSTGNADPGAYSDKPIPEHAMSVIERGKVGSIDPLNGPLASLELIVAGPFNYSWSISDVGNKEIANFANSYLEKQLLSVKAKAESNNAEIIQDLSRENNKGNNVFYFSDPRIRAQYVALSKQEQKETIRPHGKTANDDIYFRAYANNDKGLIKPLKSEEYLVGQAKAICFRRQIEPQLEKADAALQALLKEPESALNDPRNDLVVDERSVYEDKCKGVVSLKPAPEKDLKPYTSISLQDILNRQGTFNDQVRSSATARSLFLFLDRLQKDPIFSLKILSQFKNTDESIKRFSHLYRLVRETADLVASNDKLHSYALYSALSLPLLQGKIQIEHPAREIEVIDDLEKQPHLDSLSKFQNPEEHLNVRVKIGKLNPKVEKPSTLDEPVQKDPAKKKVETQTITLKSSAKQVSAQIIAASFVSAMRLVMYDYDSARSKDGQYHFGNDLYDLRYAPDEILENWTPAVSKELEGHIKMFEEPMAAAKLLSEMIDRIAASRHTSAPQKDLNELLIKSYELIKPNDRDRTEEDRALSARVEEARFQNSHH